MQLCKIQKADGSIRIGALAGDRIRLFEMSRGESLSDILHGQSPLELAHALEESSTESVPSESVTFLPPVDRQEVWAAGVTYKRSKEEREKESEGAARFYDAVYTAERPELFLKSTPDRVVGSGGTVRIRKDSKWNVPEPEITLVITPTLEIVGYTVGNDMSSRDIEGENPLYLPQAKFYDGACAVGPVVTLAESMPERESIGIRLGIVRGGSIAFEGETTVGAMARTFEDLVSWLGRETSFPDGALLLTGTGIVPPEEFTLRSGDEVVIEIDGVGVLRNLVG